MYFDALNLLKKIHELGFEAYIVGGYSRDKYLGKENYDIDICTNMKVEDAKKYFSVSNDTKFGTYKIDDFEFATFRKDEYFDNRYPVISYVDSLDEDLKRRDFIINTLCIDYNGNYIDKLGALDDLNNKIIRTVKDSNESFKEDPLRIIRALRFKLDLNFSLSDDIIDSIKKNIHLLDTISNLRKEKEFDKCLNKKELIRLVKYERESN